MAMNITIDNPESPYYIHHSNIPGIALVSQILIGDNYNAWNRLMVIALSAKNKLGFIDGSIERPDGDRNLKNTWIRNNNIVISWILNSVSKEIASSLIYFETAREIWTNLRDRFLQGNGPKIFQLRHDFINKKQNQSSIAEYFTRIKAIWEELSSFRPECTCGKCDCGGIRQLHSHIESEYTMTFLMGLNDSFAQNIEQILLMEPLPPINHIFALISQEERQRIIKQANSSGDTSNELAYSFSKEHIGINTVGSSSNRNFKKGRPHCTHCNVLGHTKDRCYKIHGYPPGFRQRHHLQNKNKYIVVNQITSTGEHKEEDNNGFSLQNPNRDQCNQLINMLSKHLNSIDKGKEEAQSFTGFMSMEGGTSNEWQNTSELRITDSELDPFSRYNAHKTEVTLASFDTFLPNDIVEKIFSFLPIASMIRAGSVCKRWHEVVHSGKFSWKSMPPQKPWYFMFTYNKKIVGCAYDSNFRKWYNFDFPCLDKCDWIVSTSRGLVCFMDYEDRNRILVCNPITRDWKQLQQPPNGVSLDYTALALSVDRFSLSYTVAVVKSKQLPDDFLQWDFTIQIYESENCVWVASFNEVLEGWRGTDDGVICNGTLYCLVFSVFGINGLHHGVVMYKLRSNSPRASLMRSVIMAPCSLTCCRLMNLGDNLVLVGGIGRLDRTGSIKGIGIWVLYKEEWQEIARMPHKFSQGFGELDDVFSCSGAGNLIFIHCYCSPALLIFDVSHKHWRWSQRCPVTKRTKRVPLQLFTGFCFEPRLEVSS